MEKVKILLVGIGGYASTYVNPLLNGVRDDVEIVGCADPFPDSCPRLAELKERGIPLFTSLDTVKALLDVLEETTLTISTIDA